MAMTASKGCVTVLVVGAGVPGRLSPNESNELAPPIRSVAVLLACICPADIILWGNAGLNEHSTRGANYRLRCLLQARGSS